MANRPTPAQIQVYREHLERLIAPAWEALSDEERARIEPEIKAVTDFLALGGLPEESKVFMDAVLYDKKRLKCPICDKWAVRQRRGLNKGMIKVLALFCQQPIASDGWVHIHDIPGHATDIGRDWVKLPHWKLLEHRPPGRTPTENSAGFWRPTDDGRKFIENKHKVHKYFLDYNNENYGFQGELVGIYDVVPFDYLEMMST